MFIISLYHTDLIFLTHKHQRGSYRQNQINHIEGFRTLGVGKKIPTWLKPLLPNALPCRIAQIDRASSEQVGFKQRCHIYP